VSPSNTQTLTPPSSPTLLLVSSNSQQCARFVKCHVKILHLIVSHQQQYLYITHYQHYIASMINDSILGGNDKRE
jgi:hypothetical protein